ncbi:ER-bound oxygenase mpaB/mpaB'/Rubber oxygenase catalytic domain-containing protein [Madurella fahalii]|uniref:ER-bound oxygenase mpaB/mpaB'/Rubber oxygenase catalytic domain-containing protein n=1 Tax=Madurella fahalii TaxID=1157608 RepID=A0ABQ0G9E0_9PEZI
MGRLEPLTSQALGRSPYDDVVLGEGPENPRGHQQMYDERGRPINPETKRINRDVIRSHNEVMMVIGVAEPENCTVDSEAEAARRHHQYEDRIGRRLLLAGGVLETAGIWGVNGMRQRILLYKEYSQVTFHGMFRLVWNQQSLASYFLAGLPSFLASTVLEQLAIPGSRKYPVLQYVTTYIRLHLAVYTFFQRTGIIPFSSLLPSWRFFIPGTSASPIPLPPAPTSLCPRGLLRWLSAFAVGLAPFAGFYLYTKVYSLITRTLRFKIYGLLPRPYNANKRKQLREATPPLGMADIPIEFRADETLEMLDPLPTPPPSSDIPTRVRRQSTVSLRGAGTNTNTAATTTAGPISGHVATGSDDFASDDEEAELVSATLISFDVEATEPTPDAHHQHPSASTAADNPNHNNNNGSSNNNSNTPNLWSAELRPNLADSSRPSGGSPSDGPETPVYRENALTRLPAVLATDVLAITPARLLMTPFAGAVWLRLARPYMARMGLSLAGVRDDAAVGFFWTFAGPLGRRAVVNLLGLELLLAVLQGEAWSLMMLVAERFRYSREEWLEREGVAGDGA